MPRQTLLLEDFSGGLDLVSTLNTLPPTFSPNAMNMRLPETGGVEKVLGYSAFATLAANGHEFHYFETKDAGTKRFVTAQPTAWQSITSAGTVANIRTGMTTTTQTTFVNYGDKVYGLDPQNIMASWDGTTLNTHADGINTGPPKGIILGIWNDQMWVATATSGAIGMNIRFSDAANFSSTNSWPTGNAVALGGVGTSDQIIAGVPMPDGLVVFTNRATYLIHDPSTGANTVIDPKRGCSSRASLAVVDGKIYGINSEGVFVTDGRFPLEIVSRNVDPLFINETPTVTSAAGTAWFGSYLGSFQRPSASANSLTLDLTARSGAIMANEYPAHRWASGQLAGNDHRLYFIDATDKTKVRRAFDGGSFAGTAISCYYQTHFDNLGIEAHLKRMHRVRVVGRGNISVGTIIDSQSVARDTELLGFTGSAGGTWNSATWDSSLWGGFEVFEGWAPTSARGRRFSFLMSETSSSVATARNALNKAQPGPVGAAGLYQVEPHFTASTRLR